MRWNWATAVPSFAGGLLVGVMLVAASCQPELTMEPRQINTTTVLVRP